MEFRILDNFVGSLVDPYRSLESNRQVNACRLFRGQRIGKNDVSAINPANMAIDSACFSKADFFKVQGV